MTSQPLRTTRRAQAALAGLGLAGAIGAAAAIGLASGGSATSDTTNPATDDAARPGTWSQPGPDDEGRYGEDGDDEGEGEGPSQQTRQLQAPPSAPQPPSGGGSHAATSGS